MNVPKLMKELRVSKKLPQKEVAEQLGITRQAYARYEDGQREPGLEAINKLCEFYNVTPSFFFRSNIKECIDEDTPLYELGNMYERTSEQLQDLTSLLSFSKIEREEGFSRKPENTLAPELIPEYKNTANKLYFDLQKIKLYMKLAIEKQDEFEKALVDCIRFCLDDSNLCQKNKN